MVDAIIVWIDECKDAILVSQVNILCSFFSLLLYLRYTWYCIELKLHFNLLRYGLKNVIEACIWVGTLYTWKENSILHIIFIYRISRLIRIHKLGQYLYASLLSAKQEFQVNLSFVSGRAFYVSITNKSVGMKWLWISRFLIS